MELQGNDFEKGWLLSSYKSQPKNEYASSNFKQSYYINPLKLGVYGAGMKNTAKK